MKNYGMPNATMTDSPKVIGFNADSNADMIKESADPEVDPTDGVILLHFTIAVGLIFAALVTALSILFILKTCE